MLLIMVPVGQNVTNYYLIIAVASTLFFVLKLFVFNLFHSTDDIGHASESDDIFSFLSIQSILAFLMGFGWIGLAAVHEYKLGVLPSLIFSFTAGILLMFLSALLMSSVKKLEKSSKIDLSKCINESGKAYTKFAVGGTGQIQITINGRLATINAVNAGNDEIEAFTQIKVTKVENNVIYVQKLIQ